MCSYITEHVQISGSGKGMIGWFTLNQANVYFDHPFHAPLDHALTIDFVNATMGPDARVAVELTPESARALIQAIEAALATGEAEHLMETKPVLVPAGVA